MPSNSGNLPTISGHLGTLDIQDVLGFLTTLGQGGALEVESPDGALTLYLEDGHVVGGQVTRLAEDEPADPDAEELYESLFRLFSWTPGDFRFYEGLTAPEEVQPVRIEVQGLLIEAARRCSEWSRLPKLYCDPTTRFELKTEPQHDDKTTLGLGEWQLLYLAADRRPLGEIWAASPLASQLETSRVLFGLASARLIQPADGRSADETLVVPRPGTDSSEKTEPPPPRAPSTETAATMEIDDVDTQPVLHQYLEFEAREETDDAAVTDAPPRLTRAQVRVARQGKLIQLVPAGDPRVFSVTDDKFQLGRAADNDLILADGHVSGHHARITLDGDRFLIEDTHSSNGIRVNGTPVFRTALYGGEVIEVYPYRFRFEVAFEVSESDE